MKHSKLFATLIMGGVGALSLASCTQDASNQIIFYCSAGDGLIDHIQAVADAFNETSDYDVVIESSGGGYDGIKSAVLNDISAGTVPSVAYCYPDHVAEYLDAGVVIDLNQYIDDPEIGFSAEEIADFIPGYWNEGFEAFGGTSRADGMYTVPFSKSTEVMYYNQTALDDLVARGVLTAEEVQNIDNWTWDEFWEICSKIENSAYSNWTPMGYDSVDNWFITLCEQYGYDYTSASTPHYLFNNDNVKSMLQTLKDKFDDHLFTTQDIYGSYTSGLFTAERTVEDPLVQEDGKASQSCVFSIGSSAGASHQESDGLFVEGVTNIPQVNPNNKKSINQGPSLVMLDQGSSDEAQAKERATWLFVKELLDPEFQATFSRSSGYIPVRISSREVSDFETWLTNEDSGLIAKTINFALNNYEMYFVSPAFNGSNTARTQVGIALTAVLRETKTIDKALSDAIDECEFAG